MKSDIIGHGTWYDKTALRIIDRERKLGRSLKLLRTEMGLGASGLPHIGSFGDAARSYAVTLALKDQEFNSELIAFSDDKDGLRKVPAGFPKKLEKHLGRPVTDIPDPYMCHSSFGEHMTSLLLEALDKGNIVYKTFTAREAYKIGLFNQEIRTILENAEQVGQIVKEEVGQERYTETLPFFPICKNCGRIYTTVAHKFLAEENKILYTCEGMEIKGRWLEGCNYEGEVDYRRGEGKLSWKSEFAVRWKALDIRFEAYGKDIEDSVRINDRICREILQYEPPLHARYEMFLDKGGRKISKSAGNVFTPQVWFRYGSPQSLILLMLKRFVGTRELSVANIPDYMNELNELEDIYFGLKQIPNKKELAKLIGLYKYCWWLTPPPKPSIHVPYNLLVYLTKIAPQNREVDYTKQKLQEYGYLKEDKFPIEQLNELIGYAQNWNEEFTEIRETTTQLMENQREAITDLVTTLEREQRAEEIQEAIYDIARKHQVKPKTFFKTLYTILLGTSSGPRLGPYIVEMGASRVKKALERVLKAS